MLTSSCLLTEKAAEAGRIISSLSPSPQPPGLDGGMALARGWREGFSSIRTRFDSSLLPLPEAAGWRGSGNPPLGVQLPSPVV